MVAASATLAAFVSPGLFYGGACAVAIPILIHLLARRRFRRIRWAAIDFLIEAERRNRRRIRLEEWVLLALRCLAVLLIAMLVARPFLTPTGLAAGWGGSRRTERVFVIDDSFSMGYQSEEDAWFERAKLAVRRVLEVVRRETPDDTVTIVRMSAVDRPVESGAYLDDERAKELLARLDALSPSQRSIDPPAVIEGLADMLGRDPGIVNAAIYMISDFQKHNWVRRETASPPGDVDAGLLAPLVAWAGRDRAMRLIFINVADEDAANTAIEKLAIPTGRLVAGTTAVVRTVVANHSERSIDRLQLSLAVGHIDRPSKAVRGLAPRHSVSVDVEVEFLRAGWESLRAELPPDALPIDNVRYLGTDVAHAIRVLIVNGEPSADAFDDEVTFLATALRPEGEMFSGNELVIVDEVELEDANLDEFHAVILANVYRVSEPAVESLELFVVRGGGVIIYLGDQVDAGLYNALLYRDGEGMLPAELTEIISADDEAHLVIVDRLHPVMRGLSREGDPLGIGRISFFKYFDCQPYAPAPADGTEDEGGGGPGLQATPATRVIATFDDAEERPTLLERSFGLGRVLLVTTGCDKEWHQWPDHPTYLPVMMELLGHVARRGGSGQEYWVGSSIQVPIDPAVFEVDAIVRTPNYPAERELGITALPAADGRGLMLQWEHTENSGLYQFILNRREGSMEANAAYTMQAPQERRLVAVNVDPRESDLSTVNEEDLRRTMAGVPFEYIRGIDRLGSETGEGRTEYWRLILGVVVAVLLGEQFLAWRWGQRR